jgi:DNA-binding transcriptional MerR regulator
VAVVPFTHEEDNLLALPIERAAKLAGVSARRLRYWDQTELVVPSIKRTLSKRSTVRLYSFGDLVDLLVVALILQEGISLRHVRKVVAYLRQRNYLTPLRELRFAVYGDEIFFQHPDGSWEGGRQPQQLVLRHVIPLQEIVARIRGAAKRSPDAVGRVVRRRKVMGRQPVFEGTRIPVATVVAYLKRGYTTERIIEAFPVLTPADVDEARKHLGAA